MSEEAREGIPLSRCGGLYMRLDTPKGRGVFARGFVAAGTLIDTCPVLILSREDAVATSKTLLDSYTYNWPDPDEPKSQTQAVVLGLGSMFNHSIRDQNVGWSRSLSNQVITYTALKDIEPGTELCINYGKVWFKDTDELSESSQEDENQVLGKIEADEF